MSQSLDSMLSARRADLEGGSGPSSPGEAPTEVISPTAAETGLGPPDGATPSPPAGPLVPIDDASAAPAVPDAHFPMTPPKVLGGLPYASNYMRLAKTIHNTELVPKAFKERPDAIMAAMMYGYELGLGPMQALNGLHVIEGKVGQDAELMRALITEQGHLFVVQSGVDEANEPWATVYCRRKDWPEEIPTAEFTWTYQDGRAAGLVQWYEKWTSSESGKRRKLVWNPWGDEPEPAWVKPETGKEAELKTASSWANYGVDMCTARVTARAARANFADVLKGMSYTPEELAEFEPTEEGTPSQPTTTAAPAVGQPANQETESTAPDEPAPANASPTPSDESATGSAPAAPASRPAKKAAKKAPAPKKTAAPTQPAPAAAESSPPLSSSTEPSQPDAPSTEPPSPPPDAGQGAVLIQLRRSLGELLDALPQANAQLCRGFLGKHFPGLKAADLNEEELTLAINIAGGWPQSADQYPLPEPEF